MRVHSDVGEIGSTQELCHWATLTLPHGYLFVYSFFDNFTFKQSYQIAQLGLELEILLRQLLRESGL